MANVRQITPFIHVADLDGAVGFFVETLGFDCPYRFADYAYVSLEGAGVRILGHAAGSPELGTPHCGFGIYVDVHDVDALEAALAPRLAALAPGDVYGPVDQSYGQRELMVRGPDDNLVVFGQAIAGT